MFSIDICYAEVYLHVSSLTLLNRWRVAAKMAVLKTVRRKTILNYVLCLESFMALKLKLAGF
jgi:hypothetical protein